MGQCLSGLLCLLKVKTHPLMKHSVLLDQTLSRYLEHLDDNFLTPISLFQ